MREREGRSIKGHFETDGRGENRWGGGKKGREPREAKTVTAKQCECPFTLPATTKQEGSYLHPHPSFPFQFYEDGQFHKDEFSIDEREELFTFKFQRQHCPICLLHRSPTTPSNGQRERERERERACPAVGPLVGGLVVCPHTHPPAGLN